MDKNLIYCQWYIFYEKVKMLFCCIVSNYISQLLICKYFPVESGLVELHWVFPIISIHNIAKLWKQNLY
jgi:hypothetical protein